MTDIEVTGGGTLYRLEPKTDLARAWVEEHVSQEGFQPEWPMVMVEHRYIDEIIQGMQADGLEVELP